MNQPLPEIGVDAVHRVVDDGLHNAFTDLVRFGGRFYLTHRSCPEGHMLFSTSKIRVWASDDGIHDWREVLSFGVAGRDVRDPHLLVLGERLFVYTGAWWVAPGDGTREINDHLGFGAWTADGETWNGPLMLEGTYGHYIWRAAAHEHTAYLCGRRRRQFVPRPEAGEDRSLLEGAMLASDDGLVWRTAALFTQDFGNETAFQFERDGSVLALARGAEGVPARVCRSQAPYTDWERTALDQDIGGPMLERWGDRWLVGGRRMTDRGNPVTALWWLVGADGSEGAVDEAGEAQPLALREAAVLPSGGDTSYPGFVALDGERGLLSYYGSHEGSGKSVAPCHIYIAEISLR